MKRAIFPASCSQACSLAFEHDQGQLSHEPRQQAGYMSATAEIQQEISLAVSSRSIHWVKLCFLHFARMSYHRRCMKDRDVPCVDGSVLSREFGAFSHCWSELPCVRPVCAALDLAAGHNALRENGSRSKARALRRTGTFGLSRLVGRLAWVHHPITCPFQPWCEE